MTDPPEAHPATLGPERLLAECEIRNTRRKGPGGQHRNRVETAVVIRHRPSGLSAEASERRTRRENQTVALRRLRVRLALELRREPAMEPSDLWRRRCRGGRVLINPRHEDYPTLLAEALDVLEQQGHDPAAAARRLGCTASQLLKLLKATPAALERLNARRREAGLHALR